MRLFKAGIVGSDDDTVAQTGGLFSHDRTFPFITVAACADYGNHFAFAFQYAVDGIQHIHQRIRSMGIIHNGGNALRRADRVESACYRVQSAEGNEHIFFFLSQQYGCAEYGKKVGSIELADKAYGQLMVVKVEQHAFKMRLQYFPLEIAEASQ